MLWMALSELSNFWVTTQQFENHRSTRFLIKRQTHIKTRKNMKICFNIAAVPSSMDIKLAVFRPAPASTHRFLLALDSGKHLPSHISSTEEKRARFPTPSLLSYAFHQPPMFPTLETNKKDERERERERVEGGGSGRYSWCCNHPGYMQYIFLLERSCHLSWDQMATLQH